MEQLAAPQAKSTFNKVFLENYFVLRCLWVLPGLRFLLWRSSKSPVEQSGHGTIYSVSTTWQPSTCTNNEILRTFTTSVQSWKYKVGIVCCHWSCWKFGFEFCFVLSLKMGTPGNLQRQQASGSIFATRQSQYQPSSSSQSASSKQTPHRGFSQMGQQSSCWPANPAQFRSLPHPVAPPSGPAAQTQNQWNFTSSFGPQKPTFVGKRSASPPQTTRETQTVSNTSHAHCE